MIGRKYGIELPGSAYDARRPRRILSFLLAEKLLRRRDLHQPRPVSMRALRRVHGDDYLESLQDPGSLVSVLGYALPEEEHDAFLLSHRNITGGTLLATRLAMAHQTTAVNLGGGFHHAMADRGQGFCVFNDVAVAIAKHRASGFRDPVLVIDFDLHDGDGTRAIFADDPTVHTLSIHNHDLGEPAAVESKSLALGSDVGDAAYLDAVERSLPPLLTRFRPGLVFYLAGSDPAADDAMGDWRISAQALLSRDRFVVRQVRGGAGRPPLVILLAGGYGHDSWRYSARFLSSMVARSALEPPQTADLTLAHYRRISRALRVSELTAEKYKEEWSLSESDLMPAANTPHRSTRLLGYYSRHGIDLALERYGIFERLRKKGFDDLTLDLELDDPTAQTVRLRTPAPDAQEIVEIRLRTESRLFEGLPMLAVDWLLMQNPRSQFDAATRPPLPGQQHPGLGMLREVSAILVLICERLDLHGLVVVPSHYHVAALSSGIFQFIEPDDQARFDALRSALRGLKLIDAAYAVEQGRVIDEASGEPAAWEPGPMVHPVSESLRARLDSASHREQVEEARRGHRFKLAGA